MKAIAGRRSIRRFASREVPRSLIEELIAAACAAPAPHHSRPWRFVEVTDATRSRLAQAIASAWQADLQAEERMAGDMERALARSRRQVTEAPLLLLACLTPDAARDWPDERRRLAERDMYMQSLGAALQNLLLAAHAGGLGGYLKGAPLFCQDAVTKALDLPTDWEPAFLVLLGYPEPAAEPSPRPTPNPNDFLVQR